jgi:hypothetical protein
MSEDSRSDTVSLSYQELADRLGIDLPSARRRVARSRWHRTLGNDRKVRVAVPRDVLPTAAPIVLATDPPTGAPTVTPTPSDGALVALLRDQLERAQADTDVARAALAAAQERWEGRLDRLATELGEERKARAAAEGKPGGCRMPWLPSRSGGRRRRRRRTA